MSNVLCEVAEKTEGSWNLRAKLQMAMIWKKRSAKTCKKAEAQGQEELLLTFTNKSREKHG